MKSETLAYKFQSAGHSAPERARAYPKPDTRLVKAFSTWLDRVPKELDGNDDDLKYYNLAHNLVKTFAKGAGKKSLLDEAHALLVVYQDHPKIASSGLFLSALYNSLRDEEIVFDLELDDAPEWLGYRLAEGKVLINRGKIGDEACRQAVGTVINYGDAGEDMGRDASGLVINYGTIGDGAGKYAGELTKSDDACRHFAIINYGKAGHELGCGSHVPVFNFGTAGHSMGEGAESLVFNFGKSGDSMGNEARAPVFNFGKTGNRLGNGASDFVVNFGKAGYRMGDDANGLVIAVRNPASFGNLRCAQRILKQYDCRKLPKLVKYIRYLRATFEPGSHDYKHVIKSLDKLWPDPAERIGANVNEICEREGMEDEA